MVSRVVLGFRVSGGISVNVGAGLSVRVSVRG